MGSLLKFRQRVLDGRGAVGEVVAADPDGHEGDQKREHRRGRADGQRGADSCGQRVIVVAGVPLGTPGATNMLRIAYVGGDSTGD